MKNRAECSHMYVVCDNEEIVGVGAIAPYYDSKTESILLTIFLLPEYEGKGIGRKIIETLELDEYFKRADRVEIPASITGVNFYRHMGYGFKKFGNIINEKGEYRLEKFPKENSTDRNSRSQVKNVDQMFEYYGIEGLVKQRPSLAGLVKQNKRKFDINMALEVANAEYAENGRSERFISIEKTALHAKGSGNANLFVQRVKGVDVKAFERVALLRGEPFQLCFMATKINGVDGRMMLDGLNLAKLDYMQIERAIEEQQRRKEEIKAKIKQTKNEEEIKRLIYSYKKIPDAAEYVIEIDNIYIPQVCHKLHINLAQK
jgi:hypothetical protein